MRRLFPLLSAVLFVASCGDSPTGPADEPMAAGKTVSGAVASGCESPGCRPGFGTVRRLDFESVPLNSAGLRTGELTAPALRLRDVRFQSAWNDEFGSASGFTVSDQTDTETGGFLNQFSSFAGSGARGSEQFGIYFPPFGSTDPAIRFDGPVSPKGVYVTNNTYAALSMTTGDQFAKQFTEADGDFFTVIFTGLLDGTETGTVEFQLADFRTASYKGIVDTWNWVDLQPLGDIDALQISFDSSDVGSFGVNTPAYVALDDLTYGL
jgi:hypothetical protein